MGKKHKHEEHVNHERWVISFADMMTLLFALFVVLYAMSKADMSKLKLIKESVQWAFHIAGEGKTKDTGIFDQQTGGGDVSAAVPLVNAQDGEMREFLKDTLPDYEEATGKSLEIVQTDDTVSMTAPLSDFFEFGQAFPLKPSVQSWLDHTIDASLTFASDLRVRIEMTDVPIGKNQFGQVQTSVDLCIARVQALRRVFLKNPQIREHMVTCEFRSQTPRVGAPATARTWEDEAVVIIAFSNARPQGN